MTTQLTISYQGGMGWLLSGADPGLAGTSSLQLDDMRLTFDAVDPGVLVEMVVFADAPDEPIGESTRREIAAILGVDAVAAIEAGAATLAVPAGPAWGVAMTLAATALRVRVDRHAPALAALSALQPVPESAPGLRAFARGFARDALSATHALAQSAARSSDVVDNLSEAARVRLRSHLQELRALLPATTGPGSRIADLDELLGHVSDREIAGLLDLLSGTTESPVPAFNSLGESVRVSLAWSVTDANPRLGSLAPRLLGAIQVQGSAPGSVTVRADLAPAPEDDPLSWVIRLHAWDGSVLGAAELTVPSGPGIGTAGAVIELEHAPDDLARHGLYVDISPSMLPALESPAMHALAFSAARRHGQLAAVARLYGDAEAEAQEWKRASAIFEALGEPESAGAARAKADAQHLQPPDWLAELLQSWSNALGEIAAAGNADRLRDELSRVAVATGAWVDAARYNERAAAMFEESGAIDEAVEHWAAAYATWVSLGDGGRAGLTLRKLQSLQRE